MINKKLIGRVWSGGVILALIGQAGALVSMVIPIVMGATDAVRVLVFFGGVAAIGANFFTYGVNSLLPVRRKFSQIYISLIFSFLSLTFGAVIIGLLFFISSFFLNSNISHVFPLSFLTFSQGGYLLLMGVLVRFDDYRLIARLRLVYGVLAVLLTTIFLICFSAWENSLLWATSLAFFLSSISVALPLLLGRIYLIRRCSRIKIRLRHYFLYLRRYWRLAFSLLISNIAFNASSLTVGKLGDVAGHWAAIVRVTGGVCTVGSQVVAPFYEMKLGSLIRNRNSDAGESIFLKVIISGSLLFLFYFLIAAPFLLIFNWFNEFEHAWYYYASAFFYALSVIPFSVANRLLLILGADRWALMLSLLKGCGVFLIIYFTNGNLLMGLFVVLEFFYTLIFFYSINARLKISGFN